MNPGRCDYIGCLDTFGAQVVRISALDPSAIEVLIDPAPIR